MSATCLSQTLLDSKRYLIAFGMAVLLPMAAHATEFIKNGDFEQNTVTSSTDDDTFMYYNPQQPTYWNGIVDWDISARDQVIVEYLNNASATAPDGQQYTNTPNTAQALPTSYTDVSTVSGDTLQPGALQTDPNGGYFVAIDGNFGSTPGSSFISQSVDGLTVGQAYTLTFWWGAVQLNAKSGPTTEYFNVQFGDQTQDTPVVANCTHCFSGWMQQTMTFVADSTTQLLTFTSMGQPQGEPPMTVLDMVSLTEADQAPALTPAVPEPSTWALLLLGCALVGGQVMHRRRAVDRPGTH